MCRLYDFCYPIEISVRTRSMLNLTPCCNSWRSRGRPPWRLACCVFSRHHDSNHWPQEGINSYSAQEGTISRAISHTLYNPHEKTFTCIQPIRYIWVGFRAAMGLKTHFRKVDFDIFVLFYRKRCIGLKRQQAKGNKQHTGSSRF